MKVGHLEITTMIGCKVACLYCPQDKISRRYQGADRMMTLEDFKTYLDKVPRDVVAHFTGFAEPFLNPACMDMIEHAARRGHPIYLNTTLAAVTPADVARLARLAFHSFGIHLPSAEELMNLAVDDAYIALLADLVAAGVVTELHFHGQEVHPRVGAWLRAHAVECRSIEIFDRAGNLDTGEVAARVSKPVAAAAHPTGVLGCERIYQNVLLPNGDVALCCMDWSAKHLLGNLRRDSFEALHKSRTFRQVLRGLRDPRVDLLCRTCSFARRLTRKQRIMRAIAAVPVLGPVAADSLHRLRRFVRRLAA
jgi:sulfatase maturation enzyme AslB (radical SAM superfamily)